MEVEAAQACPYPSGLLQWAGHHSGGARRLFDERSGRPTGNVLATNLLSRLRRWASSFGSSSDGSPRVVILVGGPGNGKTEAVESTLGWLDESLRTPDALTAQQDDNTNNLLVAVMLNMFYEYMLRIPKRPFIGHDPHLRAIDSYLLVDEAHNIMRYEFDVLRKILLQGREFGTGVILASQYLRHFKANGSDYRDPLLTWFDHKVPNATPAELSALGLSSEPAEPTERIKVLPNHHRIYKSHDASSIVIRGTPFFELTSELGSAGGPAAR